MSNAKSLMIKSFSKISAGLLVLGAISLASQAHAQTVDMPFDGNIPGSCTFGTITPGVLAKSANGFAVMAGGGGVLPIAPVTGTAARVTVTCSGNSAVTIAVPTGSGPAGFAPNTVQGIVQKGTGLNVTDMASARSGPAFDGGAGPWGITNASVPLIAGPTQLNVSLAVGTGTNLPPTPPSFVTPGNYSYTVNLSITGN
jgi:hypothetical protein